MTKGLLETLRERGLVEGETSDCIILAFLQNAPVLCARHVLEKPIPLSFCVYRLPKFPNFIHDWGVHICFNFKATTALSLTICSQHSISYLTIFGWEINGFISSLHAWAGNNKDSNFPADTSWDFPSSPRTGIDACLWERESMRGLYAPVYEKEPKFNRPKILLYTRQDTVVPFLSKNSGVTFLDSQYWYP